MTTLDKEDYCRNIYSDRNLFFFLFMVVLYNINNIKTNNILNGTFLASFFIVFYKMMFIA